MFVLTKAGAVREKIILIPSKPLYTIGRFSTDVIFQEDLSVSRTHVRVHLPKVGSNETISVEDLGSKYGTFINDGIESNTKIRAKTLMPLKHGDRVRIGALKNIWHLTRTKIVTTASSLAENEMQELLQIIKPIGGTVVQSWTDECNHLTMETVTITVKLLYALLENKPIVKVEFWRELLRMARGVHITEDLPNPENFAPDQPTDMPSIKYNPQRTKLFAGKTFVFMNRRNFDMYAPIVQKAGGACKNLNSGVRKAYLTKKDVIVIQYVPSTQSQSSETIFSIQNIVEEAGLRLIPDYEIGLAILHISTKQFCNPLHKMSEYSMPTTESMNSSILVFSTEVTQTERGTNKASEFVVPETEKVNSHKQNEPQSAPSTSSLKHKNAISSDSDEDVEHARQPKPTRKRRIVYVVDSDEDEQNKSRSCKKSKPVTEEKNLLDISQSNNEKKSNVQQEARSDSPKRTTRSNPIQQKEKETKSAASPRRSTRGMKPAERVKLPVIQNMESSDDEELFQFKSIGSAKSPIAKSSEVNAQSIDKEAAIPLVNSKVNRPARISVRNFLEKSQNQSISQCVAPSTSQPRKRLRLEQLNESDDDDDNDDLFNFAGNKKPRKSIAIDSDSSDENMFNFQSVAQKQRDNNDSDDDQDSVSTEPFIPITKNQSRYITPKAMNLPRKININGWLSCSGLHDDIKLELKADISVINPDAEATMPNVEVDEDDDIDDKVAHQKWLASIKDSMQVRMCNLNISCRIKDEIDAVGRIDSKYNGRQNFKKFVKTRHLRPQQQVLGLKRMQLAEGMLSNL